MSKFMKLVVKEKEYLIGFSNRASVLKAEREGFVKALNSMDEAPVEGTAKLLHFGMLEKQPKNTVEECNQILNDYVSENSNEEEGVDIGQISSFIMGQYTAFSGAPAGKKRIKKIEIVEI